MFARHIAISGAVVRDFFTTQVQQTKIIALSAFEFTARPFYYSNL